MDNDLQELVASLNRADKKRRAAAKAPSSKHVISLGRRKKGRPVDTRKQKIVLVAAIVALLAGFGMLIFSMASGDAPNKAAEASDGTEAVSQPGDANVSTLSGQSVYTYQGLNGKIRPKDYLEFIARKGVKLDLAPLSSIRLPADGHPLTLYCLLRSQLDFNTLQNWKVAGMITSFAPEKPFIKKVTIVNQEGLDYLNDWHVEAIATNLTMTKAAPAEPEQP